MNEITSAPATKTPEERRATLAQAVARWVAQGGRIESQSDYMAVIVYGRRVNHILHFLLGIFTLGIWWLMWIFLMMFGGEKRHMLSVDEFGNVLDQKAGSS